MLNSSITTDLRDRILKRLGFAAPPAPDLQGLRALYLAWCRSVPFDNVRNMIAVRTNDDRPLPGGDPMDFFENWLAHGTGGTCWPTSNALFELFSAVGFNARRVAGSMRDLGEANHGSVKVRIGDQDWLVDSSMLTESPLPLGTEVFIHDDPVLAVEVEPIDSTHVIWFPAPPNSGLLPCRVVTDPDSYDHYLTAYEESRQQSPFNQRLFVRRQKAGELIVLLGDTRFRKTAAGMTPETLSRDELCAALQTDIGLSTKMIDEWVLSGALDASFEPPAGPPPPPLTLMPPSGR